MAAHHNKGISRFASIQTRQSDMSKERPETSVNITEEIRFPAGLIKKKEQTNKRQFDTLG